MSRSSDVMKSHIENSLKANVTKEIFSSPRSDYGEVVHVSDLMRFCGRRYYLIWKNKLNIEKPAGGSGEGVTYLLGRELQKFVTRSLREFLIGKWYCADCQTYMFGEYWSPCPTCRKHTPRRYTELQLFLPVSQHTVRGGVDVIVYDSLMKKGYTVEVKSIKHEQFAELKEPILSHQFQEGFYLELVRRMRHKDMKKVVPNRYSFLNTYNVDPETGFILYISKGSGFTNPFKIFTLERKDVPRLEEKLDTAMAELKTFSKRRKPPKRICSTKHHLMAKECAIRDYCFQDD